MKSAFGISIPEHLGEIIDPDRCGLIIYDMQVGIVPQVPDSPQVTENCARLLASAREANMRVFYTRHTFLPNHAAGTGQLRRAMIWQRKDDPAQISPLMLRESVSWQIVPELAPQTDDVVIDKITMSAFEGTFLNLAFRDAQLKAFIIAGIATEVGIEPTVRHGADLNLIPVIVVDACGSRTQVLKDRSIATLRETGEVVISTVNEICSSLQPR
ncbi:MAG: cysteine hydrolase [Terracidiphilus sp.]